MREISKGLIEWDDRWLVGVDAIDKDHKRLIDLINELFTSKYRAYGFKDIRQNAQHLMDYTNYHFEREEQLMKKANYPGLKDQIVGHRKMQQQAAEIINDIDDRENHHLKFTNEAESLLRDWLIEHIVDSDTQISKYLEKHKIIVLEM
ncbi:MAG: hemerythrin family protein [Magnetococcales bacterium]|nr:hemerythrin family protein [Magnetococcales bacterium]